MRILTLLFVFFALVACTPNNTPTDPGPEKSPAELPEDASALVIQWEWDLGSEAEFNVQRSGPQLQIFADGRVVIHDPKGYQLSSNPDPNHVSRIEAKLEVSEVESLLQSVGRKRFFTTDSDELFEDFQEQFDRIADAGTTVITVTTREQTHKVFVYALDWIADEKSVDDTRIDHMRASELELKALRDRLIAAHTF